MRTIKTTTGVEIVLDGDLLAVMEALYREVTAKQALERSFDDMVREIQHLIGQMDDWTPAAPCEALAKRFPDRIRLVAYPGAWHDFDAPGDPVHVMDGLSETPNNVGHAHAGNNPAAQADALTKVPAFLTLRGSALAAP